MLSVSPSPFVVAGATKSPCSSPPSSACGRAASSDLMSGLAISVLQVDPWTVVVVTTGLHPARQKVPGKGWRPLRFTKVHEGP